MTSNTVNLYLEENTSSQRSGGYIMNQLRSAIPEVSDEITFESSLGKADVIHLNNVNVWSRVINGKKDRAKHFENVTRTFIVNRDTPVVVNQYGDIHYTDAYRLGYGSRFNVFGAVSKFVRGTQSVMSRLVDVVIVPSESVKNSLTNGRESSIIKGRIDESKVRVVPLGISDSYENIMETAEDKFILHVSNFSPRKNPSAIFRVARNVESEMVIVGEGWKHAVPSDIQNRQNIEVRGYIPEDELIELFNTAAVFYYPTLHEGFGMPVIEAMACGTAVVTSNVYATPEIVGDGGLRCDPRDIKDHLNTINEILEDDELRERLEQAALERAADYSWKRTARETIEIYHELL